MFETPSKKKRWKGLVYGSFGTRKTRFCLSLPKPVVIDMEAGTSMYGEEFDFKVLHASTADKVMEAVDYLLTQEHDYATLVIDPITIYWASLQDKWNKIFLNRKRSGSGHKIDFYEFQVGDWFQIKGELKALSRKLSMLDMNVVLTAHEKDEYSSKAGDTMVKTGEFIPDCEKKIVHLFDTALRFTLDADGDTIIQTKKARTPKGCEPLPKEFRLDGDTFFKCTGISGDKSKPVQMINEEQLQYIKTTEVQLISNEKYKITPDKFERKINKYGCKLEEFTDRQAQELIESLDKYIEKVNKKESK